MGGDRGAKGMRREGGTVRREKEVSKVEDHGFVLKFGTTSQYN